MTEKVSTGQKLASSPLRKATVVNDVLDAAEDFKRRRLGNGGETIRTQTPTDLVKVRNDTGGNLLPGNVVQLGGYLLDTLDKRNLWFEGNTPTDEKRFAILSEAIPSGKIGSAHVSGVCAARVNVNDIAHEKAIPVDGSTLLQSAEDGPISVLTPFTGTGEQPAVVLIGSTAKSLELFPFTLTEDMGETTPNEASANLLEWDWTTVDGDPVTIIDPAENYGFAKTDMKGLATKISRVINEGSESEETITEYHIVELVPVFEPKVVQINADLEPWDNEEFEHGCETQSGEIVEPCSATVPDPATAVDVVFIRREGREPDLSSGDRIQCVPLDLSAEPPKYLAVGEYLKAEGMPELGCGLHLDDDDNLAIDAEAIAGFGLIKEDGSQTCKLQIDYGCGLTIDEDDRLVVDAEDLAGDGLEVGEGCNLKLSHEEDSLTVVTLVECIDGKIVVTTKTITGHFTVGE